MSVTGIFRHHVSFTVWLTSRVRPWCNLSFRPDMRIFAAICLLGLLYWPANGALAQVSKQQPSSASGPKNSKSYKYRNSKYGFTFLLPPTWKRCKIVEGNWDGGDNNGPHGYEVLERGPEITIVNPRSTESDEYQDIEVMIFTNKQWNSLEEGKFFVSAAPVGPDLPPIFSPGIMRLSRVLGSPTLHLQSHSDHRKKRLRPAEPCERSRTEARSSARTPLV
jgi:hypothetical protein